MKECRWPKGCSRAVAMLDEDGRYLDLCYYHFKVREGFIDGRDGMSPGARISRGDVLSDEQVSLVRALRVLGADEGVLRQALAKVGT